MKLKIEIVLAFLLATIFFNISMAEKEFRTTQNFLKLE